MCEHLRTLQSLTEKELCELVVIPLLAKMGYREIRYTHGPRELGKDILYLSADPMRGELVQCATVKSKRLTGDVSSHRAIREVFYQVEQALTEPFIDTANGRSVSVEHVLVITPFEISQTAIASICGKLRDSENRITFMDGPKLLSRILETDPSIIAAAPDESRRYLRSLASRILETTQLTRFGAHAPLSVADVYISGKLSPIRQHDAHTLSFGTPQFYGGPTLSFRQVLAKSRCKAIIADLGSGKTTLLQMEVLEAASAERVGDEEDIIPVLIPLHSIPRNDLESYDRFVGALSTVAFQQGLSDFNIGHGALYRILLDGFDELQSRHDTVEDFIEKLARETTAEIVVTSRPTRVPQSLSGFEYWKLEPFSDEDIRAYLQKWFSDREEVLGRILKQIQDTEEISTLCRTPLFLTMYCVLASADTHRELPTRRTDMYARLSELLLSDWDTGRGVRNEYSPNLKRQVLERIAMDVHGSHEREFDVYTLEEVCADILKTMKTYSKVSQERRDVDRLSGEIVYRSSLIRENDNRGFSGPRLQFAHLSFQEFFCAGALRRQEQVVWARRLLDDWWRNVMIFVVGMKETMDDVPLPRKKDLKGKSMRLMEYLREASYTNANVRHDIFRLVASEMLHTTKNQDAFRAACRGIGHQFANALHEIVNEDSFDGIVMNYFDFLLHLRSASARVLLVKDGELLRKLTRQEAIKVLTGCVTLLEYDHWKDEFETIVKKASRFKGKWTAEANRDDPSAVSAIDEELCRAQTQGHIRKQDAEALSLLVSDCF